MATYRILCADLLSNTIREELPIKDLKWSQILDAPGAMSGWISLDHPKCTRTNLDPGATAIYIERGGILVWGGILWTAVPDQASRRLTLGAEGFWSYFRRRRIRATKTYAAQDQLFIARDLINYAQAQPGGNIGVTAGAELTTDNGGLQVLRDRTYPHYERKPVGEAVEQLAAVQAGFDFSIEAAWDATQTIPLKTFKLYYPRRGARLDGLTFDGAVTGVIQFNTPVDATALANQIDALGAGDGAAMLISTAASGTSLARYPLLEDIVDFRDVIVKNTLDGHAAAVLGRMQRPVEIPAFTLTADTVPQLGSYQVGDEGFVAVSDGWMQTSAYYRIQQYEVTVADEGVELITPSFVSADAQVY